jgi:hypothetical protein
LAKQKVKNSSLTAAAISSEREAAEARYRALFEYAPDGILNRRFPKLLSGCQPQHLYYARLTTHV